MDWQRKIDQITETLKHSDRWIYRELGTTRKILENELAWLKEQLAEERKK